MHRASSIGHGATFSNFYGAACGGRVSANDNIQLCSFAAGLGFLAIYYTIYLNYPTEKFHIALVPKTDEHGWARASVVLWPC